MRLRYRRVLDQRVDLNAKLEDFVEYFDHTLFSSLPTRVQTRLKGQRGLSIWVAFVSDLNGRAHFEARAEEREQHIFRLLFSEHILFASQLHSVNEVLAHEFFHIVHAVYRLQDLSWVSEGLAQYFQYKMTGKHTVQHIRSALREYSIPLIHNRNPHQMSHADYGHSALFFLYFFRQCFEEEYLWAYLESPEALTTSQAIDRLLLSHGRSELEHCQNFTTVFMSFEVARYYNRPYIPSQRDMNRYYLLSRRETIQALALSSRRSFNESILGLELFSPQVAHYTHNPRLRRIITRSSIPRFFINARFPFEVSQAPFEQSGRWIEQYIVFFNLPQ